MVLRPSSAVEPARRSPHEPVEGDVGVTLARLLHQPPLVAPVAVDLAGCAFVAGFGADGRVDVAADLDLEYVEGGAAGGSEEVVEDLAAFGLGIVVQQAGRTTCAHAADAVEDAAGVVAVDDERGFGGAGFGGAGFGTWSGGAGCGGGCGGGERARQRGTETPEQSGGRRGSGDGLRKAPRSAHLDCPFVEMRGPGSTLKSRCGV